MKNAEYHKRQDGAEYVFEVTPARAPKFLLRMAVGVFLVLFGVAVLSYRAMPGVLIVLFGAWVAWNGWDSRPRSHRRASYVFRVSPTAIRWDGSTIGKEDIHRLVIKNARDKRVESSVVVTTPGTPTAALLTHIASERHDAKIRDVCFSLDVEGGGKAHLLAGGMDETTAFGLLTDVSRIIGLA
jgi:hypothetical protein